MNQPTMSFQEIVSMIYYDLDVIKDDAEVIISKLSERADSKQSLGSRRSLTANFSLQTDSAVFIGGYRFKFSNSPLNGFKIDSGYIDVAVGNVSGVAKITSIDWCMSFSNHDAAYRFFEMLKTRFSLVSAKQSIEKDEGIDGEIAQFSASKAVDKSINDISISCGKALQGSNYEIRVIPYSEFAE